MSYMHGLALRLRRGGRSDTLDQLRLAVFEDLTSGRDPLDRLAPGNPWSEDPAGDRRTPPDDGPNPECGPPPDEGEDDDGDGVDAGVSAGGGQPGFLDCPGWKVEQLAPGTIRWTLPSGRTHTTRPSSYL